LTHRDILEELPLEVRNSHLVTSLLHSLPSGPILHPNYDTLDLSLDPYLEKNIECLIDGMEDWSSEQGNLQYFQRQLGREHAKIAAWQAKRVINSFLLSRPTLLFLISCPLFSPGYLIYWASFF
jgi:translation initiation factor 3 subunit H